MNDPLKWLIEFFSLRAVRGQVHRTKDEDRKRRKSHAKFKAQRIARREQRALGR
jgi:hypothetical protein